MSPPWGNLEGLRAVPKIPPTPGFLWQKILDQATLGPDSVTLG